MSSESLDWACLYPHILAKPLLSPFRSDRERSAVASAGAGQVPSCPWHREPLQGPITQGVPTAEAPHTVLPGCSLQGGLHRPSSAGLAGGRGSPLTSLPAAPAACGAATGQICHHLGFLGFLGSSELRPAAHTGLGLAVQSCCGHTVDRGHGWAGTAPSGHMRH